MKKNLPRAVTATRQQGLSLLQTLGVLMLVGIAAAVLLKQWA